MTNDELKVQFKLCQEWNDPEQWEALAFTYADAGYPDNAAYCLRMAETMRFSDGTTRTVDLAERYG